MTVATKVNSLPEVTDPPDSTELAPEFTVKVMLVDTDPAALRQNSIIINPAMHDTKKRF
jgi:hypothetical protein